ncbi:MAG: UDP-glucose 4-epimerase GalE [Rhodospirillaceae bacterium]
MAGDAVVLVTGGAGYIGSHAVYALRANGLRVVVIDDLSTGHRHLLPPDIPFYLGSCGDRALVERVIAECSVSAIMHFAASLVVTESLTRPLDYYRNNTVNSQVLIETALLNGVKFFIFSSTAAVYGNIERSLIAEVERTDPINPYGTSKLMIEWMLRDTAAAHDFHYIALRYFNVAGADPEGRTGEITPQATHLFEIACQTALGRRREMMIFGTDYPTPDGTCIRDYIHVTDLADAHVLAYRHLLQGGDNQVLNCGYGHGVSVRQVIDAIERTTGRALPIREGPRRPGDPAALVADSSRLRAIFGWRPRFDDLPTIAGHALTWEARLPTPGLHLD